MKLAPKPRLFCEYEYRIKDGPIVEGRLDPTMPNSLSQQRYRMFQGGKEITGKDIKARVTHVTYRVFPNDKGKHPYFDVFVQGTQLGVADSPPLLIHHLDINKEARKLFLAEHPEYK
jgi:hypothetical protein